MGWCRYGVVLGVTGNPPIFRFGIGFGGDFANNVYGRGVLQGTDTLVLYGGVEEFFFEAVTINQLAVNSNTPVVDFEDASHGTFDVIHSVIARQGQAFEINNSIDLRITVNKFRGLNFVEFNGSSDSINFETRQATVDGTVLIDNSSGSNIFKIGNLINSTAIGAQMVISSTGKLFLEMDIITDSDIDASDYGGPTPLIYVTSGAVYGKFGTVRLGRTFVTQTGGYRNFTINEISNSGWPTFYYRNNGDDSPSVTADTFYSIHSK